MKGYLLDTNVISKFAPDRPRPSLALVNWMKEKGEAEVLFLSVITVAEIHKGIKSLERRGSTKKAEGLQIWFDGMLSTFDDQILAMDKAIALAAGEIEAFATSTGHNAGLADIMIAATAKVNDLVTVTENIRHFLPMGIAVELPPSD